MQLKRLTRKQIREQIASTPVEDILHVKGRTLTTKQKAYCQKVAEGKPFNKAYREAYDSKANPKTIGVEVNRMNKDPRIALEVEAQKRAIAFQSAYSAKELKAIVISQLTQEALDPESKASERISALKALGSVAELSVFKTISEVRTIKDSASAKADLLAKLRDAIKDQKRTVDSEINSLMDEIYEKNPEVEKEIAQEPLEAGPPTPMSPNASSAHPSILHTIPHKQSPNENDSQTTEGGG
jgi:gas vesicle protein